MWKCFPCRLKAAFRRRSNRIPPHKHPSHVHCLFLKEQVKQPTRKKTAHYLQSEHGERPRIEAGVGLVTSHVSPKLQDRPMY